MIEQVKYGIVRILTENGDVGTGFVVTKEGLIATCSHVVQNERSQYRGDPPPEKITVIFQATGDQLEARVEPKWWLPCDEGDLAVLRIEGTLPSDVQPLLLGSSKGTGGHEFSTFGYPKIDDIKGIGGDGKVVQLLSSPERTLIQLSSNQVTVGFSGAPIWDTLTRRVIGVVCEIANPDVHLRLNTTAFAASSEMLQKLCPLLRIADICPYVGLAAFQEAEAEFFQGCQLVIDRLLSRLRKEPRFLTILGPSGSGKSSLIRAGLIPHLKTGKIPRSDRWEVFLLRPASDPLAALANYGLADETHILAEHAEIWLDLHPQQERVVLIFDQFEEVFVSCPENILQRFVEQLVQLLQSSQPVSVILVMRDDFYSQMARQEALITWVEQSGGLFQIPRDIAKSELEDVVQKPAEVVGLRFEKGLVEVIVRETIEATRETESDGLAARRTVLPLLESALHELWEERDEGMLTHKGYKKIGAVGGALNRWAEKAYFELKEEDRQLAQRIFTDLIYLGDEKQGVLDSRRRRALTVLSRQDQEKQDVEDVVHYLSGEHHRLLVTDRDPQTGNETVEIIHDVLLRTWGMLRHWIEDDRESLQWHQDLEKPLRVWKTQHDKSKLLRGPELREAKKWAKKHPTDLSQDERAFLRASVKQRMNLVVMSLAVVFLILSLTGATGWYYVHQTPDPTRVTNLNDDGPGSLRYDINNIRSGTITFASGLKGVIKLTSGEITMKGKVTIDGPGADVLAVRSGDSNSALFISPGASVTISGLSFQDSSFSGMSFLNNSGTLSLVNSTLLNNQVVSTAGALNSGGAIENNGVLSIRDSNIMNNSALNPVFDGTAHAQIGGGYGGGIYNAENGTVTVMNSTIAGNSADAGGGIENITGSVIVMNSTISGNFAEQGGGGIDTTGPLTFINSTLADNAVGDSLSQIVGSGGGILASYQGTGPEPLLLAFDTIYGNTSLGTGGAIENAEDILTIRDSIVVGNTTSSGPDIAGQDPPATFGGPGPGLVTTEGYNLFQNVGGDSFTDPNGLQNTDRIVTSRDLSTIFGPNPQLQDNGVVTKTYALLPVPNNPALGKIPLDDCHIPGILNNQSHQYTDQRGTPRPNDKEHLCDIGAYEVGEPPRAQPPSTLLTPTPTTAPLPLGESLTEFSTSANPLGTMIIDGPDGNVWFNAMVSIGRITPFGTITLFPLSPGQASIGITAGPDGNVWFAEVGNNQQMIGRITPTGTITEFLVPSQITLGGGMTAGPDGSVWFLATRGTASLIGRITPTGTITEFLVPSQITLSGGMTAGPDGSVWFTATRGTTSASGVVLIGRITPSGTITLFPLSPQIGPLGNMTAGPDGDVWFLATRGTASLIGRITPTGTTTLFPLPPPSIGMLSHGVSNAPAGITSGPDGNVWFTQYFSNQIGRITPTGMITEFSMNTPDVGLMGITGGPNDTIWVTEQLGNKIGRIEIGQLR